MLLKLPYDFRSLRLSSEEPYPESLLGVGWRGSESRVVARVASVATSFISPNEVADKESSYRLGSRTCGSFEGDVVKREGSTDSIDLVLPAVW